MIKCLLGMLFAIYLQQLLLLQLRSYCNYWLVSWLTFAKNLFERNL